ncbi:hypothetical protein ACVWZT_004880 [Pseudomonas sp. TE21394]
MQQVPAPALAQCPQTGCVEGGLAPAGRQLECRYSSALSRNAGAM